MPDDLSHPKPGKVKFFEENGRLDSEDLAIELDSAYKHYGSGKTKTPVLMGLDMKVTKGQIYGLLGELYTIPT